MQARTMLPSFSLAVLLVALLGPTGFNAQCTSGAGCVPTFPLRQVIATGLNGASGLGVSDFTNNDGDNDIVVASALDNRITLLDNDGASAPSFSASTTSSLLIGVQRVAVGDVNSDTFQDFAVATGAGRLVWFRNSNGIGSFSTHVIDTTVTGAVNVAIGDVTGDGNVDIVVAAGGLNSVLLFRNDGSESFSREVLSAVAMDAFAIEIADMDGDSDNDIIYNTDSAILILFQDGVNSGTYSSSPVTVVSVTGIFDLHVGDLNADSSVDIVAASVLTGRIITLTNDGTGTSFVGKTVATLSGPVSVFIGNVDQDDNMDIAVADNTDSVYWLQGDGAGGFAQLLISDTVSEAFDVVIADMDNDGVNDILVASRSDDQVLLFSNDCCLATTTTTTDATTTTAIVTTTTTNTNICGVDADLGGKRGKGVLHDTLIGVSALGDTSQSCNMNNPPSLSQSYLWRSKSKQNVVVDTKGSILNNITISIRATHTCLGASEIACGVNAVSFKAKKKTEYVIVIGSQSAGVFQLNIRDNCKLPFHTEATCKLDCKEKTKKSTKGRVFKPLIRVLDDCPKCACERDLEKEKKKAKKERKKAKRAVKREKKKKKEEEQEATTPKVYCPEPQDCNCAFDKVAVWLKTTAGCRYCSCLNAKDVF